MKTTIDGCKSAWDVREYLATDRRTLGSLRGGYIYTFSHRPGYCDVDHIGREVVAALDADYGCLRTYPTPSAAVRAGVGAYARAIRAHVAERDCREARGDVSIDIFWRRFGAPKIEITAEKV